MTLYLLVAGELATWAPPISRCRGGKALIVDQDDHLGGKCPKNACYVHHLFYDCAVELDFSRQFADKLWWPEFDSKVAILPIIDLFMDSGRFIQMARQASWKRGGRREGS